MKYRVLIQPKIKQTYIIIKPIYYKFIIKTLEDQGLYRAMMEVKDETPLSFEEALAELEQQ